jgi:muconolactone delta-isomerase
LPNERDPKAHAKRCGAKTRQGGECQQPAMQGQARCRMHGGKTPRVMAAAQRRLAEDRVRRALDEVGVREIDNPLAELKSLTAEVVAFKDLAAAHVAALEDRLASTDAKGSEQVRAQVELYERALDRSGKFLEMWARLGIDAMLAEMQVKVTEAQAALIGKGFDAYRTAAGVTAEQHTQGMEALARVIRAA